MERVCLGLTPQVSGRDDVVNGGHWHTISPDHGSQMRGTIFTLTTKDLNSRSDT